MSVNGVSMSGATSPLMIMDGDPAAEIAALSLHSASEQRDIARTERDTAETSEVAEDAAQISALHQKADQLRSEATNEMWAGIAEGGAQVLSGAISINGAGDTSSKTSGLAKGVDGAGKLLGTIGHVDAGYDKSNAANLDADAAAHEKAADMAKHRVDDARDLAHDASDAANKALDWYRDYSSARSEATAAALHRA